MLRLSSARVEARSLVRELSLHMAHGQKKKVLVLFQDTQQPKEGWEIRGKGMEDDRGRGHTEDMKEKEARAYVGRGPYVR